MTVVSEYLPKFIDYRLRYQNDSSFFKYEFVSFSDEYRTVRYTVADYIYGGSFYDPYFLESDEW